MSARRSLRLPPTLPLVLLTFLVGAGSAVYLTWPQFVSTEVYASGLCQSVHFVAYHSAAFSPSDLLVEYSAFNESPLQNLLFFVGTYVADPVRLSNVLTAVFFGAAAVLFFLVGQALFDTPTGLSAAVLFSLLPEQAGYFNGASSRSWGIPLTLVGVYLLHRNRPAWFLALLPFSALAHPPATILVGLVALTYLGLTFREDRRQGMLGAEYLFVGGIIAVVLLSVKHLAPPPDIGLLTPGAVLRALPEMNPGGITACLPALPVTEEVLRHLAHPVILWGAVLFLAVLGPRRLAWETTWTALLIAGVVGYVAADRFFMTLYLPQHYTNYSLAVLWSLWGARNAVLTLRRVPWRWGRRVGFLALVAAGLFLSRTELHRGKYALHEERYARVCSFLRTLPAGVLLAGHPETLNQIPIQGRRAVLCNYKLAHPWFSAYYREMRARLRASLKAFYAEDVRPLNDLARLYGVTHFVVEKRFLRPNRRVRQNREPYSRYERRLRARNRHLFLSRPPTDSLLYEDADFVVLRLPLK